MKFYTDNLLKIWESESCVWLFTTPWIIQSMEFSQARILEGVTYPFSRGSSQPRDWTQVSINAGRFLPAEPQGKPKNTAVGSLSLLQQIFPTQELNWGLLHCRWILYQLSYQGRPIHKIKYTNWAIREDLFHEIKYILFHILYFQADSSVSINLSMCVFSCVHMDYSHARWTHGL